MKKRYLILFFLSTLVFAQTGIGTTSPSPSAKLEVASTNQGFLPPRIALTATNAASPVTSPATGLLVFNTETAGIAPNNVTPGYYYWNGSLWVRLNGPSDTAANVTGIVPVVNGGTGTTTSTGSGSVVLSTSPSISLPTFTSGSLQFPQSLLISPTSHVTSKRAAIWLDGWSILQDVEGNGTKNFSIGETVVGTPTQYPPRLVIAQGNGNIGLGTSSPTARLNLVGGGIKIHNGFSRSTARPSLTTLSIGNYEIRGVGSIGGNTQIDGADDGFLRLSAGGGSSVSAQSSIDISGGSDNPDMNNSLVFRTSGTERFRVNSSGNIGIGTTTPSVSLQVAGDIIANSIAGSSDARFKSNILPIENSLQKVQQLRGVTFDWKTKEFQERAFSDNRALGFIAQEVEKVLPEVVQTEKTAEGYKSVQYDKVVALLVEAIKEQQKQIQVLQKEIKKIKKRKK
ncbi:tail fiber domain-containing protein [Flavobacterium ammonificans]|uniref:Peptidase S74 domain-containing protein n=1 Tax=Flavobacterium ammonificans TaxID=1751056 RepID=A0ABM7V1K1_9FLAO|nr:tail fiber domain-containing protein [Flavobacterium ammonificans]BDB52203.1 hypothetical protein GENT11_05150 [Flavobacterium ammonificans]